MKAHGIMLEHIGQVVMFVNPATDEDVYYLVGTLEFARGIEDFAEVRFTGDPDTYLVGLDWDMLLKERF